MTKTEQAEMQELGMTPEGLKEAQANVKDLLGKMGAVPLKPKKPRSDKGKPRKPAPAQAGALTQEWFDRLNDLNDTIETRSALMHAAEDHATQCIAAYADAKRERDQHIASGQKGA